MCLQARLRSARPAVNCAKGARKTETRDDCRLMLRGVCCWAYSHWQVIGSRLVLAGSRRQGEYVRQHTMRVAVVIISGSKHMLHQCVIPAVLLPRRMPHVATESRTGPCGSDHVGEVPPLSTHMLQGDALPQGGVWAALWRDHRRARKGRHRCVLDMSVRRLPLAALVLCPA